MPELEIHVPDESVEYQAYLQKAELFVGRWMLCSCLEGLGKGQQFMRSIGSMSFPAINTAWYGKIRPTTSYESYQTKPFSCGRICALHERMFMNQLL